MKVFLVNLGLLVAIILAYYFNIFSLFAQKYFIFFALGLVIVLFIVAWKIIGNPFNGNKNEKDD